MGQKLFVVLSQGQARGYGPITHFLQLPKMGHAFHKVTVTQQVGQFERYELCLSTDTFWFAVGQVV